MWNCIITDEWSERSNIRQDCMPNLWRFWNIQFHVCIHPSIRLSIRLSARPSVCLSSLFIHFSIPMCAISGLYFPVPLLVNKVNLSISLSLLLSVPLVSAANRRSYIDLESSPGGGTSHLLIDQAEKYRNPGEAIRCLTRRRAARREERRGGREEESLFTSWNL